MINYMIVIACAILLYFIASKVIDKINRIRLHAGLDKKITIVLTDNETVVSDSLGNEVFRDTNELFCIRTLSGDLRIIGFGTTRPSEVKDKLLSRTVFIGNFIEELETLLTEIHDFGYQ